MIQASVCFHTVGCPCCRKKENTIPTYFFHLRRGNDLIPDERGEELPDADAAYLQAFAAAQELWTTALTRRDDPTAYTFEVTDADQRFLFSLPLNEVLETSRKGRKRVTPREVRALLERNRMLRNSIEEQILQTRNALERTYDLLRALRARG